MAVLGFNYTKLHAERKKPVRGRVSINNHVHITDVEETDLSFQEGKKALNIGFEYSSNYEPEVAVLEIEGNLLYTEDDKVVKDMMKSWKDNKKFPKDRMTEVLNVVLGRCNVQAILMSRDLNIPSPIPLPKVGGDAEAPKEKKSSKKSSKKKK